MTESTNSAKKKKSPKGTKVVASVRGDGYKFTNLEDIFRMYPYKTQDWDGKGAVPFPYVPKTEITEGPYSVTWKQWRAIIKCYFKYLIRFMMHGYTYKVPWGMGFFSLVKQKRAKPDMKEMMDAKKRGEIIPYVTKYPKATEGFTIILLWSKGRNTTVRFKWNSFYRIVLDRGIYMGIVKAITHDRSILYRLNS